MCGIAGFNWSDKSLIEKMNRRLRHRGPDDEGYYVDDEVSLGHRRLSILDLSEKGHQPMSIEHLIAVYNGEIYNFRQLRSELSAKGYQFVSGTDTEVLLYSYLEWGESCVERFNGMWAFCLYDKKKNTLFLSRDRFGIKPLYYYHAGGRFVFASELKAIREHALDVKVSREGLNFYFNQKYIGGEFTIYEDCFKLLPGENLTFDIKQKTCARKKYYDLEDEIRKCQETPVEQRIDAIADLIPDAVEKRLMADVPVGSFLSGGVDSSLISAVIARKEKNFRTFSIGFTDKSYNELEYSKLVSRHLGTDHHYQYLDVDEKLAGYLIKNMDEPFGDSSLLPTYLLSKMTRERVTVSLSGDAGDEVFGGYDSYQAYRLAERVPRFVTDMLGKVATMLGPSEKKLSLRFKIRKFVNDYHADVNRRHLNWMGTFNDADRRELLGEGFGELESFISYGEENSLLSLQLNDIANYLAEDILKKVDLASMLNSLEVRVPFLDYRLVPLVLSLPDEYKIRNCKTKWLLKRIAGSYLPRRIIRRPKRGFTVPISQWIKNSSLIKRFVSDRQYYEHGLLNYDYVGRLFREHVNGKADWARQLWLVFVFNYWWNENMGEKNSAAAAR